MRAFKITCFAGFFVVLLGVTSSAEDAFDYLRRQKVTKIEGMFERRLGPLKASHQTIEAEKLRIQNQISEQINPQGRSLLLQQTADKLIEKAQRDFVDGSYAKYLFTCYIGSESILLHLKKVSDTGAVISESWDQQFKDHSIEYSPSTESIAIYPHSISQWSDLGVLSYALGSFGDPDSVGISEVLREGKIPVSDKSGEGQAFYKAGQLGMLSEYSAVFDNGRRSSTWQFTRNAPFPKIGRGSLPMNITQHLKMELRDEKLTVDLTNIEASESVSEPMLPKFQLVSVKDARFKPALTYMCSSVLPNDESVARMVVDQAFKEKFSTDAQRNLR